MPADWQISRILGATYEEILKRKYQLVPHKAVAEVSKIGKL